MTKRPKQQQPRPSASRPARGSGGQEASPPHPPAAVKPDAPRADHAPSHNKLKEREARVATVDETIAGARLDKALTELLAQKAQQNQSELSRTRIRSLIEAGHVQLQAVGGGTIVDPSYRVKFGQSFAIVLPELAPAVPTAQAIPLTIVYEDAQLLVVDKPAGLVVHPAPGNPDFTLVNALLAHCGDELSGIGGVRRPGIVHRIDKDTSGLMVVAKTDIAHASLSAQFAAHSLDRAYLAVVWGAPEPAAGEVSGAIGRDPRQRQRMTVVARGGKVALTRYKTLRRLGRVPGTTTPVASLLECRLATGRTHQIRVHMAWLGHPLLGDETYKAVKRGRRQPARPLAAAAAAKRLGRQALHAYRIGFQHPLSGEQLTFEASLPSDIKELIGNLETL